MVRLIAEILDRDVLVVLTSASRPDPASSIEAVQTKVIGHLADTIFIFFFHPTSGSGRSLTCINIISDLVMTDLPPMLEMLLLLLTTCFGSNSGKGLRRC